MTYLAPSEELLFVLRHVAGVERLFCTEKYEEFCFEDLDLVLRSVSRIAETNLYPLQRSGDSTPAFLENGVVRCSPGYREGYQVVAENGFVGMSASPTYGGMGMPVAFQNAANEIINGACMALGLNPLLTQGQIELLELSASASIKEKFLPHLVEGNWAGTMVITEPQAGSDVGSIRTRAVAGDDGSFSLTGDKIFISWADSDFCDNICHLVLARLDASPHGTRGLSLFLVPKLMPDQNGQFKVRNRVSITRLEEKLGLHGSPTAAVRLDGAVGWLVGEKNRGLEAMFQMMNLARLGVGSQGVGVADAALQLAEQYAVNRVQGRSTGSNVPCRIVDQPDVRRMLLTMRAQVFAARAICSSCAVAVDMARATGDRAWRRRAALLTPVAKAFGSETAVEVSRLGISVHGGAGYIEEAGAAQYLRDAIVTTIYEGTNGIQAIDLVQRKLGGDGTAITEFLLEIRQRSATGNGAIISMENKFRQDWARIREVTDWIVTSRKRSSVLAGATYYLRALALLTGARFHIMAAVAEEKPGARAALASVYFNRLMPEVASLCEMVVCGDKDIYAGAFAPKSRE